MSFLSKIAGKIYLLFAKKKFEKYNKKLTLQFPIDLKTTDKICIILPSTSKALKEMILSIEKVLKKFKDEKILIGVDFLEEHFKEYQNVIYIPYKREQGLRFLGQYKQIKKTLENTKALLDLSRQNEVWKIAVLSKIPYRFSGKSNLYPYFNIVYDLSEHFEDKLYSEKLVEFFLKFVKEEKEKNEKENKGGKNNQTIKSGNNRGKRKLSNSTKNH